MIRPDPKIRNYSTNAIIETYPNPQFDNFNQNPYNWGTIGQKITQKFSKNQKVDYLITASDMIAQGCARVLSENEKKG